MRNNSIYRISFYPPYMDLSSRKIKTVMYLLKEVLVKTTAMLLHQQIK